MAVFLSRSLPCGGEGSVRAWAETQCQPAPPGVPPRRCRWRALEAPPLVLTPLPVYLGRRAHTAAQPNCKIKFPRCSGPRSSCVLSGEEMGIGESCACSLPAHPAFPVPPSTAGAVNHGRPASGPRTPRPRRFSGGWGGVGWGRGCGRSHRWGEGSPPCLTAPESLSRGGRGTGAV